MTTHVATIGVLAVLSSVALRAQSPPPINGVTGSVALEGTTNKVDRALNIVIVKTVDGVEHIVHYTKDLLVHGGKNTGGDALRGLEEGRTVVVHYTMNGTQETAQEIDSVGDDGLKTSEGVVAKVIDRERKQVTIRFADGTTETLMLTDRAAAEAAAGLTSKEGAKVVVYYSDESGRKVAHYFKKVS